MSILPPAANKKQDGCAYPNCACTDVFCKEVEAPMNSPADELKRLEEKYLAAITSSGLAIVDRETGEHLLDGETVSLRKWQAVAELLNTRAESPDSVEGATYEDACDAVQDGFQQLVSVLGIDIDNFDGDGAEAYLLGLGLKKIAEMLNPLGLVFNSDEWVLSPPPPVAAEGELIDKLGKWISGLPKDKPCPGKEMADAIVLITESYIALQSRSTPPPVAGGELIRRASLEATSLDLWASDLLQIAKSKCGEVCEADQCCKERYNAGQLDDAARMIRELIAALQHQDGVCQYRINADGFANTDCGEELYIEFGADYTPTFCQCCGKRAQRQSLERKNGQ